MKGKNFGLYVGTISILLVVCGICVFFSIEETRYAIKINFNGIKSDGRLADIRMEYSDGDSSERYFVEYSAGDSLFVTKTWFHGLEKENFHIGDTLEIVYPALEPGNARVNLFTEKYLPLVVSLSFGILSILSMILVIKKKEWVLSREPG